MAANGQIASKYACKCLNIRIHAQPTQNTPPSAEAGFDAVHVGEEGIRVAHTEVTLRSRSKPVPDPDSPSGELTRYTTVTCLVCGIPTYRVLQRITPDLINEVGPLLPSDDWVEKELLKSTTGWVEVYHGCLTNDEIMQAESSPMYSSMFSIVLPGPRPPSETARDEGISDLPDARGPSEQSKRHLPDLPPLFLPPPFTPSNIVFSHFSSLATERSEKLRNEAEEYIAQVTQQKVVELRKAESVMKEEVNLVWSKFREAIKLIDETGTLTKAALPLRRRGSVSGNVRALTSPAPGTSASVRIDNFEPTPSPPPRISSSTRQPAPSALSASLKTSGFQYPDAQRQVNGNVPAPRRSLDFGPPSRGRGSPSRSRGAQVDSPSTASTRTAAVTIDPEASIREAYRREMDESKDIATSFRYVMGLEAQMEEDRSQEEAEAPSPRPPAASNSQAAAETSTASTSRGRSPRMHKSAIKHAQAAEQSKSEKSDEGSAQASGAPESKDKGKRKVTFDVKPEVAIIKGESGGDSEQDSASSALIDPIFDMDNESEQGANTPTEAPAEPPKPVPASSDRIRAPPRITRKRLSNDSGLLSVLDSLRPASLPAPSTMRSSIRQPASPVTESSERQRNLRESLLAATAKTSRPDYVESPIEISSSREEDDEMSSDPREEEILRLVAASTPSHRSAWKKNSKAWQLFLNRRERRSNDVDPDSISEEGHYASMDDFDPQPHRTFNGVADSDVTDEDDEDDKWANEQPIAQSLPIPIGPIGQHGPSFGRPSYQPKTSLSDRPGVLVPALRNGSSSSLRRASYAERDRKRSIDPGALDFAVDNDVADEDVESDPETGGKARQRALKILQARDDMPAAGMWRSLA
ncbi:hypothetical protein BN946_scf184908.g152 [Trametes cinnabarina]|uniref:Uncharacterized protein n=1 Tax=Pycnoporus cinnabarinus TaxID=5643 RepID=A0A060SGP1_PYCCI|nr:hypothetical protein BN946_scf184908.g152 [Trametes cinnabarina]